MNVQAVALPTINPLMFSEPKPPSFPFASAYKPFDIWNVYLYEIKRHKLIRASKGQKHKGKLGPVT